MAEQFIPKGLTAKVIGTLAQQNIKDIKNLPFEEVIRMITAGDIAEPVSFELPLDTVTDNWQFPVAGNYFGVIDATDQSVEISVRFNKEQNEALSFSKGLYMVRPYNQLFLSWEAQAGKTVTIIISAYAKELFEIMDFRSATQLSSDMSDLLDQIKGVATPLGFDLVTLDTDPHLVVAANTQRRSVIIQAALGNTSTVYIGFDNTTATTKYVVALKPGDQYSIDDYQGAIWASSATATDKVSYGEV
ncbi:MAG: hypothetical protein PHS46_08470 [Candidatus Omnitrophica bacterium]|nr:hypothetical protein [Candidatus Omnitrophota bacterium]